jgi:hypothetical protein
MLGRACSLVALACASCAYVGDAFVCATDAQCSAAGANSRCEPTHYCSVPDSSCTSQHRYDRSAGSGLANACVGDVDAGVPMDAGSDGGGPSLCPSFTGLACQDFEQALSSPWGMGMSSGGTLTIDTNRFYRGAKSGHMSVPPQNNNAAAGAQLDWQFTPGLSALYIRSFYYIPTAPASGFWMLSLHEGSTPFSGFGFSLNTDGTMSVGANYGGSPQSERVPFPYGRWVCIEVSVTFATAGHVGVRVDDVDQPTMGIDLDTAPTPPLQNTFNGAYVNPGAVTPAWEMWIDEVAIDTQPIGCTR